MVKVRRHKAHVDKAAAVKVKEAQESQMWTSRNVRE